MSTAVSSNNQLELGIPGFTYADLYAPPRLRALFERWHEALHAANPALAARYDALRATQGNDLTPVQLSELLVELAPSVSRFVAKLFNVEAEWNAQRARAESELHVMRFKDEFVKRRALKRKADDCSRIDGDRVLHALGVVGERADDERHVAMAVLSLLDREAELKKRPVDDPELLAVRNDLTALEQWVVARKPELGKKWLSFKFAPPTPDALNLVELRRPSEELRELIVGPLEHRRARDGFRLTDRRMTPSQVLAEVDYCL